MAQAKKKTQTQKRKTTAGRKTTAKNTRRSASAKRTGEEGMEPALKKELVFFAGLAVMVLLFCSNMHWCGTLGEMLYRLLRGIFGVVGYIIPFYLFLVICFLLSNEGSRRAVVRVLVSVLVVAAF